MNTAMYTGKQARVGVRAADSLPRIEREAEEEKAQTERVLWERHIQQEAVHHACKKGGPLLLGGKEALLKQLTERVTRQAQEERDRALLRERASMMIGSYD